MRVVMRQSRWVVGAGAGVIVLALALWSWAGSLEPSGPPAETMHTLDEIYAAVQQTSADGGGLLSGGFEPPPPLEAAFIKYEGIDGESEDARHEDWCDLWAFTQGQERTPDGGGAGGTGGSLKMGTIRTYKAVDKANPKLAEAVCTGDQIPSVQIDVCSPGLTAEATPYLQYELTDVRIVGYQLIGTPAAEGWPMEEVTLTFQEVTVTYTVLDELGRPGAKIEYDWDLTPASP